MSTELEAMDYADQQDEWQAIKDELIDKSPDHSVTAFDVSEEQRRRMAERGQREPTLKEIEAQLKAKGLV